MQTKTSLRITGVIRRFAPCDNGNAPACCALTLLSGSVVLRISSHTNSFYPSPIGPKAYAAEEIGWFDEMIGGSLGEAGEFLAAETREMTKGRIFRPGFLGEQDALPNHTFIRLIAARFSCDSAIAANLLIEGRGGVLFWYRRF